MMMHERTSFRRFFEELIQAPGHAAHGVLWAWLDPARRLLDPLRSLGKWEARMWTIDDGDNRVDDKLLYGLWALYAFSRVSDILLLPYQKGEHGGSWRGPAIRADERLAFFTALGLERMDQSLFHPFYHEVVNVDVGRVGTPATVLDEIWPGFMLGQLAFCRAGVCVQAGTDIMLKHVAEGSTLYWAYRRKNRPYQDLSQGWGSNSQWRTRFRRDYTDGSIYIYNVDGRLDARLSGPSPRPNPARDDLSPDERVELLVNRCFVRTCKPHSDLFPYHDTLTTADHIHSDDE
jgi:hypothetical protein